MDPTSQMPQIQITVPITLWPHLHIIFIILASTLLYSTTNCTQKARSLFREHMHSRKEFICWNNLSLFCCHLQEILFVNFEEPPPLLSGQIRSTPSLIEPDRRFIPLCHKEVHTAAAGPHSNLTQVLQNFWPNAKSSIFSHHIKIFKIQQFPNPWIVSKVIHGKSHNAVFWNKGWNFS